MATSQRASRALQFMQQCRQSQRQQHQRTIQQHRPVSNTSSLEPESFGKRMRITPGPAYSNKLSQEDEDFPESRKIPVPRYRHNPAIKPGFLSYVKYRILRMREPPNPNDSSKPSFNVLTNPYRIRKQWPPVLAEMSEDQQFHYEKKFRRRLMHKTNAARFNWNTWTLFFRKLLIGSVIFYYAFAYDSSEPDGHLPSDGLRFALYGWLREGNGEECGGEGTQIWPRRLGSWIERQYRFYRRKHKEIWDPNNEEGWDTTRPVNTLPGPTASIPNRPLESPVR